MTNTHKESTEKDILYFCKKCNKQLHRIWSISTQENEYYDDGDRVNLHYCKEKLKKAKGIHQPCRQEVYTTMEKIEGKYPIFDDEEGKTIHNCPKKQHTEEYPTKIMSEVPCVKKYSNKRTKEEVEKIMEDIIKFAIIMIKTNKDYSRLSEQEIERAMTVLIQSQVELYK